MTEGLRKGLTSYGHAGFSLFLRKAFIKAMGYSDERAVRLDGRPLTIVGVTPPNFFGVEVGVRNDVAVPMCADPLFSDDGKGRISNRIAWWVSAMAD